MTIDGFQFQVLSPSAYKLVGSSIMILYAGPAGWFIYGNNNRIHSKPFESRDQAIKFLSDTLDDLLP